jgi:sec-independent protein translocase protein TatA
VRLLQGFRKLAAQLHFIETQQGDSMFEGLFQPMHLLIIAGIALLIFGPKKLPQLGKGLGESIRGFKSAMAAKDENLGPKPQPNDERPTTDYQRRGTMY